MAADAAWIELIFPTVPAFLDDKAMLAGGLPIGGCVLIRSRKRGQC
jgi:hypothetical protein